jgi:hypothetical protein
MYACITGALTGSPTFCNALRNFGNKFGDPISIAPLAHYPPPKTAPA